MKTIVILIDYFGDWPGWFPTFLASCRCNCSVNWVIRTDCKIPNVVPSNVKFIHVEYVDYIRNVSERLGIEFNPSGAYKICDIRPAFGDLYYEDIAGFDFFGFGDLDVIYGDIRKFYTDDVLAHDVISSHEGILSGHLVLFRNIESLRKAYLSIPGWKGYLEDPESTRFDEDVFSCLFVRRDNLKIDQIKRRFPHDYSLDLLQMIFRSPFKGTSFINFSGYFKEQYSTVFHPMPWHDGEPTHPDVWFWKDGHVTNDRNIGREYLYLHLMNFQSMRWADPDSVARRIPWKNNPASSFVQEGEEMDGVRIDWNGIHPL